MMQKLKSFKNSLAPGKRLVLPLIIVSCLLVVAAGGVYYQSAQSFTYNQLDKYTFKPKVPELTISFDKPIQMKVLSSTSDQIELEHIQKAIIGKGRLSAYTAMAVVPTGQELTNDDLENIALALSTPQQVFYAQQIGVLKQFIQDRVDQGANITYSDAKEFKNAQVKNNSWQLDFETKTTGHTSLKGIAIMFVNKKAYTFFMISMPDKTWQKNVNTNNKVLQSIDINS